ncbi:ester cyclase [Mycobacterium yunnanensis]|uniref:Ester cyclase n=1 Tax=Mycobacterium yunnanensis TaxID=368477 RepID=A0A9X2YI38_9MYCO|nr:ester cyclase [Mycobacterium yunnanensis]MCV7419682.1 ester cyclase [Mycobacterium yunnanensis]
MSDLLNVYRDYLSCLNDRRWSDLDHYVADAVVHNDRALGLAGYRAMLEADTEAIPDLRFVPEILLADDRVVSCRLAFDCTPRHPFLGFEATGRRVSFAENVFYRFDGGKIVRVWSVIDRDAISRQGFERSLNP